MTVDQDGVLQNNAHMPRNDAAFCVWVLRQLYTTERSHMVEPFYHVGSGRPDMRTVYQRLESGQFANAAEFEEALMSVPLACLYNGKKPWDPPVHYTRGQQGKASDLVLELPKRFKGRNGWERRKSQQQGPIVASTSASATAAPAATPTAAAPVHTPALAQLADSDAASASASAADAATDAHQQSRFATSLVDRTSATPRPSGGPTTSSRQGATGPLASNHGASEHPARVDPDATSRQVSKAVDHESGLREARRGKKRASSDQGIGSSSKRPRQEVEKLRYRYVIIPVPLPVQDTDEQQ